MKARPQRHAKRSGRAALSRPAANAPRAEKETLLALFNEGNWPAAEQRARILNEKFPADSFAWKALGTILVQDNRSHEALAPLQQARTLSPDEPEIHNSLGTALQNTGRCAEAMASYQQALRLKPGYAEAHFNLGNVLQHLARVLDALDSYQRALKFKPGYAEAHYQCGIVLQDLGRSDEALVHYRRAVAIKPDYAAAHFQRGVAAQGLGHLQEALAAYAQSIALRPDDAAAHNNLGNTWKALGKPQEALSCYRRALACQSDLAEAYDNAGVVLQDVDRTEEAIACHQRALALRPDFAVAHCNLGTAWQGLGEPERAVKSFQRAVALQPDLAEAHCNLGSAWHELGRFDEAANCHRRALAIRPDFPEAHFGLGRAQHGLEDIDAASANYRRAIELEPRNPAFRSGLLFLQEYSRSADPQLRLREARAWEQYVLTDSEREAARRRQFAIPSRQGRPLRVGIVSAELGRHAVAHFLLPWLRAVDRQRVQVLLYPTTRRREPEVALLQELADRWTPLYGRSDADAADLIRADQVDVLLDTTGHTRDCRLGVFAHRAAPVQCHYIGYFATTGLTEMDYLLADEVLLPPSLHDRFCEQIWRLPRTWVAYAPLEDAPPISWQPDPHGRLRLGSFNNVSKLHADCLAIWARILEQLPTAQLLLKEKYTADLLAQQRVRQTLASHGVEPHRVQFLPKVTSWQQHMECYDQLDVALDTLPVGSGTTGFDALWMGVPLITYAGDWLAGRLGAAMLTGLGHPAWIAHTADEYVAKAVALARDQTLRAQLRPHQRARLQSGPLGDAAHLARVLEDAFEAMFDRWWQQQSSA
jgi:predicted O-linked N-acetylglucosamine transferase (SPINDLY family)